MLTAAMLWGAVSVATALLIGAVNGHRKRTARLRAEIERKERGW